MTAELPIRDWAYKQFLEEAPELLGTIEQNLLTLCTEQRSQSVKGILRATHTFKGAAATVGLETIVSVAHGFEDIVQCLSQSELIISIELFSLLLESFDRLRFLTNAKLTDVPLDEKEISQEIESLFEQLRKKLGTHYPQQNYFPTTPELNGFDLVQSIFEEGIQKRLEVLAKLLIKSNETTEVEKTLRSELKLLVELANSLNLPGFSLIAQTALNALEIRPQEALTIAKVALDDLLEGQEAILNGDRERGGEPSPALLHLAQIPQPQSDRSSSENIWEELDRMLEEFSQTSPQESETLNATQAFDGDSIEIVTSPLKEAELTYPLKSIEEDDFKLPPKEELNPKRHERPLETISESYPSSTVRVKLEGLERIDRAVDEIQIQHHHQLSENETLQSVLQALLKSQQQHQHTIERLYYWTQKLQQDSALPNREIESELKLLTEKSLTETENLQSALEFLEQRAKSQQKDAQKQQRLVSDLQDNLINTRMVPLKEVFNRLTQAVRQLESVHFKPVSLKLEGTNILIESAIAQKLYAPLLHLIRNAFDHGIEPTEIRQGHRKPEIGQLEVSAYQQGWQTIIEVKDDGQGLDFDRIRDRAIALNLISAEAARGLSTQQLSELLFKPGFSTSLKISELSGRGIGLEAVKADVEALGGTCTVRSQPYQGTTFSLRFPMTLTIVKLTGVEAGKRLYALLSDTIEKILLTDATEIVFSQGKKFLSYTRNTEKLLIPIYQLSALITYQSPIVEINNSPAETSNRPSYIVLLRYGQKLLGLEVEQVFGEQKTAIKPLGSAIMPPIYVYGCSIVSQNRLALVIDGVALVREVQVTQQRQQLSALPSFNTHSFPTLPIKKIPSLAPQGQENSSVFMPSPATVLLVDDSIGQRHQTALTLQKAGYRVLQAKNGLDAIEQLQMESQKVQLVVCDLEMPNLNGFEFLSYCRHQEKWAKLPVIILANRGGKQQRKISLGLGASAFFTRPYIESDLLSAITNLIEQ